MLRLPLPSPRRDSVFAGALVLLALGVLASLLPMPLGGADASWLISNPLGIAAALLAVLVRPQGESARATAFWRLVGAGLAFFFLAQLWHLAAAQSWLPPAVLRRPELLYVGRYLFLVMALEMRPDLPRPGRSEDELRRLDTTGAVLFLFSLITYVLVSPPLGAPVPSTRFPAGVLYLVLDAFLVLRALGLRVQARSALWSAVYGWLALVVVLRGLVTLAGAAGGSAELAPLGAVPRVGLAWFVPLLPLVIAARLRAEPDAATKVVERYAAAEARLAPLVAYAFAFPIFHFLIEWLGIVDDETAAVRGLVVLGFLGVAAVLLWIYQRVLIRENQRLEGERKVVAEQAAEIRRLEGLGRLAGGVAHDFNNLLTVIRGRTELLLAEHAADETLREDLEAIRQAARRGEGVTRQLLAFGRRQILRPEVLDVRRVLEEVEPLLRSAVSEEVRLSVAAEDPELLIVADQGQVEMALLNLAVNAREAMPGGGELMIEVDSVELDGRSAGQIPDAKPGSYVRLTVQDTGRGMDAATLERIFEPFFTTKPFGTGAGLGLPAVHGFVRQSGGAVRVTSAPGRGTIIRIYLPRAQAAVPAPEEDPTGIASGERL
jgi:signal transduction histidine kinase